MKKIFYNKIKKTILASLIGLSLLVFSGCSSRKESQPYIDTKNTTLHLNSRFVSSDMTGFHNAIYVESKGLRLLSKVFLKITGIVGKIIPSHLTFIPDYLMAIVVTALPHCLIISRDE